MLQKLIFLIKIIHAQIINIYKYIINNNNKLIVLPKFGSLGTIALPLKKYVEYNLLC